MCQTLDAVFQPSSHLLSSYKKYGLRLVFRWFRDFVYSCDHQTTLYKTLNNRHTPPLKSEPKKISLRSIKNHPLLKIWISDENTASPVRYITYSSHWLVYSTSPGKLKLCKLPFQCPRVQTSDVVWDILICEVSMRKFHGWNTACPVWYRVFSLTWPASMQIYWRKRKRLHKKGIQLPEDWFGTPTWPPFHCFGTPIWPPWRHVKLLYMTYSSLL